MRILTNIEKTIRERVDINAPIDEVFDFAQDGATADLTTWSGLNVACIRYDRPHSMVIKMTKGPSFLRQFAGTWRFLYIDEERTAVVFLYQFEMAAGVEWLEPVTKAFFRWDMHRRLRALKRDVELRNQGCDERLAA